MKQISLDIKKRKISCKKNSLMNENYMCPKYHKTWLSIDNLNRYNSSYCVIKQ